MCDRHHAQRKAICSVYGDGIRVLYCCVHIARNIQRNVGPNSRLLSLFWEMRSKRSPESENAFIEYIKGMHSSRASLFTTYLLNSLEAFLPSKIDAALRRERFKAVSLSRSVATSSFLIDTEPKKRAMSVLTIFNEESPLIDNVFKKDNTNTIESYFNVIKGRIPKSEPRLLDIFAAIDFTEKSMLAQKIPRRLLSQMTSRDVS